jgi:chitin disaccharide deacetylase
VKGLVVNGDDLGASPGVNRGLLEAHQRGPLTSASLIVNLAASHQAARLACELPALSVGLHANLTDRSGRPLVDLETGARCRTVLQRQLDSFHNLMGRPPTHLDSHHNLHRNPRLLPWFLELADSHGLPLRDHSPVRYLSRFYGQWSGRTHLEQISVEGLLRLLENETAEGVTELGCHPGYCDSELRSSYRMERETELQTLCDPRVQRFLASRGIRLLDFREAMGLLTGASREEGPECPPSWSRRTGP